MATLEELVTITREEGQAQGRTIGIYPELKNTFATNKILADRGETLRLEDIVLEELSRLGFQVLLLLRLLLLPGCHGPGAATEL